jgi:hypothetical protein
LFRRDDVDDDDAGPHPFRRVTTGVVAILVDARANALIFRARVRQSMSLCKKCTF